jgi:hypothetical protein
MNRVCVFDMVVHPELLVCDWVDPSRDYSHLVLVQAQIFDAVRVPHNIVCLNH